MISKTALISKFGKRKFKQYQQGEEQKVSIAQIIINLLILHFIFRSQIAPAHLG